MFLIGFRFSYIYSMWRQPLKYLTLCTFISIEFANIQMVKITCAEKIYKGQFAWSIIHTGYIYVVLYIMNSFLNESLHRVVRFLLMFPYSFFKLNSAFDPGRTPLYMA